MQVSLFINGERHVGQGASFEVINPATEAVAARGNLASVAQLDQAVAAARRAFPAWSATADAERTALLHRIADRIETNSDELARIIVAGTGQAALPGPNGSGRRRGLDPLQRRSGDPGQGA